MWVRDIDTGKWSFSNDSIKKTDFDSLKQELQSVKFYSKCLSGATYLSINNFNNIYDILIDSPKSWYISSLGSPYSVSSLPSKNPTPITSITSNEYYDKFLPEYGLTLKNLFTPNRLINDSIKNFLYVDVSTTEEITNLGQTSINLSIDGIKLKEGHRVLVKDQKSYVTLLNTVDPNTYFESNYYDIEIDSSLVPPVSGPSTTYFYYNEQNGIYIFKNSVLIREDDLNEYDDCVRYSVFVKLGLKNRENQYHLSRLKNGYYPTVNELKPIEFIKKHNWLLRNRVDYNNVLDINYYDVIKHGSQQYYDRISGSTYSIPERIIGIGEFGMILNFQNETSHIINNKFKTNLRGISQTSGYYWICGDEGLVIKVSKVNFELTRIELSTDKIIVPFNSISFYNDVRGVVVGDINTIFITSDGGFNWDRILIDDFKSYNYNKVLYSSIDKFYIGGDAGVFIEFTFTNGQWIAYKRRVSKFIDEDDDYLLVDDINDLIKMTTSTWGLSYSYSTQSIPSNKEMIGIVSNNNNVIFHDINNFSGYPFLYLDFGQDYGDIKSIINKSGSDQFYFSSDNIYSFELNDFLYLGSSVSNIISGTGATLSYVASPNEMYDYNGTELIIAGNNSLLDSSTYSVLFFDELDSTLNDRLKSKLLFLDYGIGSKLNFFDDNQVYRLPNSLTFSSASFSNSELDFTEISGETNWLTYWRDRSKTFEYYSSLSDSNKVLMSVTFSYGTPSSQFSLTSSQITIEQVDIIPLAPSFLNPSDGRFIAGTISITSTTASYDLFLYDYLMINRVSTSYPVEIGDVIYFDSSVITGEFIVNKIYNDGLYIYFYSFTDFNQNILNQLKGITSSISITNLNKYQTIGELNTQFNLHPISNGYEMIYSTSSNIIQIDAVFNNISAYYNLQTNVNLDGLSYTMSYTESFLKFGYKPTYNLLGYFENINSSIFTPSREVFALPTYYYIPGPQYYYPISGFTVSNIYIDSNVVTNKLIFGVDLQFEWESIFINTFVDVNLHLGTTIILSTVSTEKLLVMNKYYDSDLNAYIIEFHKKINYTLGDDILSIDIVSRRSFQQISDDLQELNDIHRGQNIISEIQPGFTYTNYENELNFKISTNSYASALLSDSEIVENLSALIYIDYKNELSMNITKLDREFQIPIQYTSNFLTGSNNYLYITCLEKHGLVDKEGVVLEFNGGTGSSEDLNPQYFGFHTIGYISDYDFFVYTSFGTPTITTTDPGFVKYVRKDPFFNYQPVDVFDLGIDKKSKIGVDIRPENVELNGSTYSLINVDTTKYKFKLFDGLTLDILNERYPWILEAEISNALIGMDSDQNLVWYNGIWYCGRWFGGTATHSVATWISGTWISGDWYGGTWDSKSIKNKLISIDVDSTVTNSSNSIWFDGRWFGGTWKNGTWYNGRWYGGTWEDGFWYNGIWNDGIWNDGNFIGGIWVSGLWNDGIFSTDNKPAYWLDGKWNGGDFENGMWYNGVWDQKNGKRSRFGINSFNSRTSTWHGGKWLGGEFHSKMNINDDGLVDISDVHKYSIWKTGLWSTGDWYGGIAYDINFKSGIWHGGILEDIQVIGINTDPISPSFTLNGIFKFNIGDEITIIDNNIGNSFSVYGNNDLPGKYKVITQEEDLINKWTILYVDKSLIGTYSIQGYDLGINVVSTFNSSTWLSGIWTNGVFDNGLWDGGIWIAGVFNGTWG